MRFVCFVIASVLGALVGNGAAQAQQTARAHRGMLVWRSRPGHTVFTLLLPLAEEARDG